MKYSSLLKFFIMINKKKILKYCGKHSGETCFIIGNGPSIKDVDLVSLRSEYTFGTNRIYLHNSLNHFILNYYCASDNSILSETGFKKFLINNNTTFFLNYNFLKSWVVLKNQRKNIELLYMNTNKRLWDERKLSQDLHLETYWAHTVILEFCIPLAFYMGFKRIYLLGCDTNYSSETTHFYGNNTNANSIAGSISRENWYGLVLKGYNIVKEYALNNDIEIYDCALNSKLNQFEKISLETALRNIN